MSVRRKQSKMTTSASEAAASAHLLSRESAPTTITKAAPPSLSDFCGKLVTNLIGKSCFSISQLDRVIETVKTIMSGVQKKEISDQTVFESIDRNYNLLFVPKTQIVPSMLGNASAPFAKPAQARQYTLPRTHLKDTFTRQQTDNLTTIEALKKSKFANVKPGSAKWKQIKENMISGTNMKIFFDDTYHDKCEIFFEKVGLYKAKIDSFNCYHGNKHEMNAGNAYAHLKNVTLWLNPPLIQSELEPLIAATPDFCCQGTSLDGTDGKHELAGYIVEIKCVVSRIIISIGDIYNNICPYYYYWQIQAQMYTSRLMKTDFCQCKIVEYEYEDFIKDTTPLDNGFSLETGMFKSCMIEMVKESHLRIVTKENINDVTAFIHLHVYGLNNTQIATWIAEQMNTIHTDKNQLYVDGYVFRRVIYFKFEKIQINTIDYDPTFEDKIPEMKAFWKRVEFARKNKKVGCLLYEHYRELTENHTVKDKKRKGEIKKEMLQMIEDYYTGKKTLVEKKNRDDESDPVSEDDANEADESEASGDESASKAESTSEESEEASESEEDESPKKKK